MGSQNSFQINNKLLKAKYGFCLYNSNDINTTHFIKYYDEYFILKSKLFSEFVSKGDSVVEVGSNIGVDTKYLAHQVGSYGKVFAFESQRVVFQNLCANIALNSIANVYAYNVFVGSKKEDNNSLNLDDKVQQITLDSFEKQITNLKLIKVDIEKLKDVLKGASSLIKRFQPILYLKNDNLENSSDILQYLLSIGYDIYWHLPPFNHCDNFFKSIVSINILCFPKDYKIDFDISKHFLQKVIDINHHPKSVKYLCQKAQKYAKQSQFQKAVDTYEKALKVAPTYLGTYFEFASLLKFLNKSKEVLELFLIALKYHPKDYRVHNNIAMVKRW